MLESARIMYEIYQEQGYSGRFRVVYFTELNEHSRETEINRALVGRHVHDGFIPEWRKDRSKALIEDYVAGLNDGRPQDLGNLEAALRIIADSLQEAR